jgi:hypothetical protein
MMWAFGASDEMTVLNQIIHENVHKLNNGEGGPELIVRTIELMNRRNELFVKIKNAHIK